MRCSLFFTKWHGLLCFHTLHHTYTHQGQQNENQSIKSMHWLRSNFFLATQAAVSPKTETKFQMMIQPLIVSINKSKAAQTLEIQLLTIIKNNDTFSKQFHFFPCHFFRLARRKKKSQNWHCPLQIMFFLSFLCVFRCLALCYTRCAMGKHFLLLSISYKKNWKSANNWSNAEPKTSLIRWSHTEQTCISHLQCWCNSWISMR